MLKAWVCFYSQWSSVISLLSFWNLHPIKQAYILSRWMSWGYFNETVTPALHFKALILSPFVSTLKHAPSVSLLADLTIYFPSTFFFLSLSTPLNALFHLSEDVYLFCSHFLLRVNLLSQAVYLPDPACKQYFSAFIAPVSSAESNLTSLLHLQQQQHLP